MFWEKERERERRRHYHLRGAKARLRSLDFSLFLLFSSISRNMLLSCFIYNLYNFLFVSFLNSLSKWSNFKSYVTSFSPVPLNDRFLTANNPEITSYRTGFLMLNVMWLDTVLRLFHLCFDISKTTSIFLELKMKHQ